MSKQAYKFRLYPTRKQRERLQKTLDACRTLYKAALTERRDAYNFHVRQHPNYYDAATRKERSHELAINYYSQANQLPEIKDIREEYQDVHSQVLQDVLRRLQKAFDAFFRRVRNGEEPGYPRFQGKNRYDSFTYPQAGFSLTHDSHVCLSKIGSIKVKFHRGIKGAIGGFRRRKLPEKPRGFSPGESSRYSMSVAQRFSRPKGVSSTMKKYVLESK